MQIPRFAFEKFPGAKAELTTQMKSVGEAMAMGRTFQESFQKALRSLETGCDGWSLPRKWKRMTEQQLVYGLRVPNPERMLVLKQVGAGHMTSVQDYQSLFVWAQTLLLLAITACTIRCTVLCLSAVRHGFLMGKKLLGPQCLS